MSPGQGLYGFVTRTAQLMVIDHANGLHECVDDDRPAKFMAALFEVFCELF